MTLLNAILRKVQSHESLKKYPSPPPEFDIIKTQVLKHKKKRMFVSNVRHAKNVLWFIYCFTETS